MPAGGGQATILVTGGVSAFAVSPTGDRIAFIRSGHVQVLMLGGGQTIAVSGSTAATAVAWTRDRLLWADADGIFAAGPTAAGGSKVTSNPDPAGTFVSIAPDGAHAILRNGAGALVLVDVSSGGTTPLGSAAAARFQGWSPDGTRVIHDGVISDMTGNLVGRLPQGDASWSAQGTILVGGDSSLVALKPDGSGQVQLASGNSFRLPAWAPDGSTFGFVRGNSLWVASVPSVSRPQSRPIDDATAVVNAFMQARLAGDLVKAMSYLDDNARAQYAAAGPVLIPVRDLGFKRYYILAAEVDATSPNTVRFVVRLAFAGRGGPIERNMSEETLILKRATVNDPFLIDRVIVSPVRQLGRGPVVVAVRITPTQVAVTFDSDLQPPTINGVVVQDSNGTPVNATVSYADRTITFSGLQLTAGASYRIVVLPTVLDIGNQKPAQEYDLDFVGPGVDTTSTSLSGAAGGDGNQQAIGG